jgi:general secretion pathway protein M
MKTMDVIKQLWDAREPRERTLISLAAAVVVLSGLYAGVIDPALTGTARLKNSLPQAQAQLAQVQALSLQVQALPKTSQDSADASQASIEASLAAASIDGAVSTGSPWKISIRQSSGDALWTWLRQNPASTADLKRSGDANTIWHGDVVLAQ